VLDQAERAVIGTEMLAICLQGVVGSAVSEYRQMIEGVFGCSA